MLDIIVGLVFSRHFFHTILSIIRAFPSAIVLFRIRTMIVLSNYFLEPAIDFAVFMAILWQFLNCGLFFNDGGLRRLFADSHEAK